MVWILREPVGQSAKQRHENFDIAVGPVSEYLFECLLRGVDVTHQGVGAFVGRFEQNRATVVRVGALTYVALVDEHADFFTDARRLRSKASRDGPVTNRSMAANRAEGLDRNRSERHSSAVLDLATSSPVVLHFRNRRKRLGHGAQVVGTIHSHSVAIIIAN